MKRLNDLVFKAQDTEKSFQGTLTYPDKSLSAWSYDLDVSKPQQGKLSGNLPDNGGKIDQKTGILSIRKLWNNEVLITEKYNPVSESEYEDKLSALVP